MSTNLSEFPVTVYGDIEPYNDVLSKARCRIFYKGFNRNGGYIEDNFAEKLASTVPYAPVKGIYNKDDEDYTDHGKERTEGRIYGIVPENPNGTYETHLDEDGVEREYYCVDVYLFTGLYGDEAYSIVGKSQSMELFGPSIQGIWQVIDGKKVFVYTDACFLGLQVLGENVEPCFEGAAFYTLQNSLDKLFDKIREFENGGNSEMPELNFKLSDSAKYNLIFNAINSNYTEEGNWEIEFAICDIYDDYALCYNYADGTYSRIAYSKNDEANTVEVGERTQVFMVDVTKEEFDALEEMKKKRCCSLTEIEEVYVKVDELTEANSALEAEKAEFCQQKVETEEMLSTLTIERDGLVEQVSSLNAEVEALRTYKADIELNAKKTVIEKYTAQIPDEILSKYKDSIETYTVTELEKELAYEFVTNKPSVFSVNEEKPQYVPKDSAPTGAEALLAKYKAIKE